MDNTGGQKRLRTLDFRQYFSNIYLAPAELVANDRNGKSPPVLVFVVFEVTSMVPPAELVANDRNRKSND